MMLSASSVLLEVSYCFVGAGFGYSLGSSGGISLRSVSATNFGILLGGSAVNPRECSIASATHLGTSKRGCCFFSFFS